MDFENIDSNDEDYGNQLNKLRRNKPRKRLFKPSNNISMNKVSGRKRILNASKNKSLLEPKTSKVKKNNNEIYDESIDFPARNTR
ncbi:unnamed protein product [Brachionus calyciflorus]|uniref:Uncharacterized protein n=1 Tax=Brachionus calyciflorus TaxID=104777 RepID=A0A814CDX8_9BILA|nr:unnamed protein product [Brachionus calyciflorus]